MPGTRPSDRSIYADGTPTCAVVIVNVRGEMHAHDPECGDLTRRAIYKPATPRNPFGIEPNDLTDTYEVRDLREAVDSVFGPDCGSYYTESGYEGTEAERNETAWTEYAGEFKVFPCVDLPRDIGGLRHTEEPAQTLDEVLDSPELAEVLALPEEPYLKVEAILAVKQEEREQS